MTADTPAIKLLQWNVGNFDVHLRPGGRGPRGMQYTHATPSRPEDLEAMASVIRAEAPDVITLQEIILRQGHHKTLAELSGDYFVAAEGDPDDRHTQVILLHRGLESSSALFPELSGFKAVAVRVRGPGARDLIVVSTHSQAGKFTSQRAGQHRALAAWASKAGKSGHVVVAGDLNFDSDPGSFPHWLNGLRRRFRFIPELASSDWDEDCAGMKALFDALGDLSAQSGRTAGAPRLWPRILVPWGVPMIPLAWCLGVGKRRARLDYVLGSRELASLGARALRVSGPGAPGHPAAPRGAFPWMDHDPVVARFSLP
ncbi:endonuclease/exonuclease/phosphatase family protein [Elusimicrobiota bacterium]